MITVTATSIPPTTTPTSEAPSVLLIRTEGNTIISEELAQTVAGLAAESGLTFRTSPELTPGLITPATRRVIFDAEGPGVETLAENPSVEFFAVGPESVVRSRPEQASASEEFELRRAFAGGYGASLLATEWRLGGILPAGASTVPQAFVQGGVYGCGLCNPLHPPFVEYPLVEVSGSEQESLAALEALSLQGVSVIFLGHGIATRSVAGAAADKGMLILAADPPPQGSLQNWAGSILADLPAALRLAWNAEDGEDAWVAPLALEYTDPGVFSPGRQDDLERLFEGLGTGAVKVLTAP